MSESVSTERAQVLASVKEQRSRLYELPEAFKRDPEIVLAAVKLNGLALRAAAKACRGDRDIVLAAVMQDGRALQAAAEACKGDRDIVLAAVTQNGRALKHAADACKGDRDIVLAAVTEDGNALQYASEACQRDRQIAETAVEQNPFINLDLVAEALLLDGTFAVEAKSKVYILKVSLLSGRYVYQTFSSESVSTVLADCCEALGVEMSGTEALVYGAEVIPGDASVQNFPGIEPPGQISEYYLVVGGQQL